MSNKPIPAIQRILSDFQKDFYEDVHYMTRASHGIVPVGVKCKMSPIEAEDWLKERLNKLQKTHESELLNERERIDRNIGMLRQWLNEDRIKDADNFVTNEELEHWLGLAELKEGGE